MADPVSKHSKGLDNRVLQVFKHVVHLHFCAEGHPVTILLGSLFTVDMTGRGDCLRSVETNE